MDWQDILAAGADQMERQREREAQEQTRQLRMARAQASQRPAAPAEGLYGAPAFMAFANNAMAPGMTAHANAISQVNNAIASEMQSRVAQEREGRRMQHEKDMLLMRLRGASQPATQLDGTTAALAVLQQENAAGRHSTARNNALRKLGML